jgi:hypothetical protein
MVVFVRQLCLIAQPYSAVLSPTDVTLRDLLAGTLCRPEGYILPQHAGIRL